MLDTFEILSTSGVVLWSKTYVPVGASVINSLIKDVFIEERSATAIDESAAAQKPVYRKEGYTLKWTTAKDLGLIFVAVYQSLLHLSWIDKLLDNVRSLFTELYRNQLKQPHTTNFNGKFDDYFDRQVQELEKLDDGSSARPSEPTSSVELTPPSSSGGDPDDAPPPPPPIPGLRKAPQKPMYSETISTDVTPVPTPDTSRPASPAVSHLLTAKVGPGGRTSRRGRRQAAAAVGPAPLSSGDESPAARAKGATKGAAKKKRVWDADGLAADEDESTVLDYSTPAPSEPATSASTLESIDQSTWGSRTKRGEFVLKDLDEEIDSILASASGKSPDLSSSTGLLGSSLGALSGLFRNVVGGKTLTRADLDKPLKAMEEHLLKKNVAREAAVRLCDSVAQDLLNTKTSNFTSVDNTIRSAMESALRKILTPTSSLDLLREIQTARARDRRPYVISIVGVNGVGKSTNLSKLAFFLLQNRLRVLVVAADTFRSGAVEQLRVHVTNLAELSAREAGSAVALYERGYGRDAANIAKDAVEHAAREGWDVVLIDTAGRRHNDQRLMSSLEKFAKLAQPDKIFQVAEALVGADAVQQARNFNESFGTARVGREAVGPGGRRQNLDGFIISKCDTVGDMVGTLVSMVHATGVPVVFLGTGQHYSDLRNLNVGWAVRLLMS